MDEWNECIKKAWYIYTREYYSAIKKETVPCATTWMDLEGTMLSEISPTGKDKHCMISLTCGILKKQAHRNRDQNCACQRQRVEGRGDWVKVVKRYKLPVVR